MAKLLVNVVAHPEAPEAVQRGDVLAILDDALEFGAEELAHPDWCVLPVPGASESWSDLLGPQHRQAPDPHAPRRFRAAYLDLDAPELRDSPRACVRLHPPLPSHPADFGGHPSLIG